MHSQGRGQPEGGAPAADSNKLHGALRHTAVLDMLQRWARCYVRHAAAGHRFPKKQRTANAPPSNMAWSLASASGPWPRNLRPSTDLAACGSTYSASAYTAGGASAAQVVGQHLGWWLGQPTQPLPAAHACVGRSAFQVQKACWV